ncbi:MAG: hypothetical protein R3315_08485 [Woeseiaceae bacterium]|nr:hypothetical protein [Woeseiaceae bacterium]
MGTRSSNTDDGLIGLGVLVLLVIAFIAGQFQHPSGWSQVGFDSAAPDVGDYMLIGDPGFVSSGSGGAIRELRVLPSALEQLPDLNWSPREALLREHREQGF